MFKKVSIKGAASRLHRFLKTADAGLPLPGVRHIGGDWYQPIGPAPRVSQGRNWDHGVQTQPPQAWQYSAENREFDPPSMGPHAYLRPGWYDYARTLQDQLGFAGNGPSASGGFGGPLVSGIHPYRAPGAASPYSQNAPRYMPSTDPNARWHVFGARFIPAWEHPLPADVYGGVNNGTSSFTPSIPSPVPPIHYPVPNLWTPPPVGGGVNTGVFRQSSPVQPSGMNMPPTP